MENLCSSRHPTPPHPFLKFATWYCGLSPSLSLEKHGCLSKDSRLGRRARTLPSNSTSIRRIVLAVDENWRQLTRAKRIYSWEFCRHLISSGVLHDLSTLRCLFYLWYRHDARYEAATVRVCCGCPCSCCNSHDSSRKPKNDGIFDGKILEKLPLGTFHFYSDPPLWMRRFLQVKFWGKIASEGSKVKERTIEILS